MAGAAQLAAWERGWSSANALAPDAERQFPDSLLADPDVRFVAGHCETGLVAGAIFNRSEAEVGVSNMFTADSDKSALWPDLIDQARGLFGGLPIVGYDQGHSVACACRAGFEDVGGLRVWLATARDST